VNLSTRDVKYLYLIYRYEVELGSKRITSGGLSKILNVSQPTVVEVLERLNEKGLVEYRKRYGVSLTKYGLRVAREIIWRHRVLESFLSKILKLDPDYVCKVIQGIEHKIDKEIIIRMYEYLDKPSKCPHGGEIPCI